MNQIHDLSCEKLFFKPKYISESIRLVFSHYGYSRIPSTQYRSGNASKKKEKSYSFRAIPTQFLSVTGQRNGIFHIFILSRLVSLNQFRNRNYKQFAKWYIKFEIATQRQTGFNLLFLRCCCLQFTNKQICPSIKTIYNSNW